ncbi:hypothetical protein Efla_004517 [Eimeria flavescens]
MWSHDPVACQREPLLGRPSLSQGTRKAANWTTMTPSKSPGLPTTMGAFTPPAEDAEEAARRKASLEQYLRADALAFEAAEPSQQPTSQFPCSLNEPLPYSQTGSKAVLTPWGESTDDATLQSLLSRDAWMERLPPIVQEQAVGRPAGEAEEAGPAHLPPSAEFPATNAAFTPTIRESSTLEKDCASKNALSLRVKQECGLFTDLFEIKLTESLVAVCA